jgi:hypothetical protein
MRVVFNVCAWLMLAAHVGSVRAQAPVADSNYRPPIARPAYAKDNGPVVRIDEAHRNYHTLEGRYAPFAELLRRDGFRVESSKAEFSAATLTSASIMVIANAEAAQTGQAAASAFTNAEIAALRQWVERGGSLLVIADHPPFSDSAVALAQAFGFEFVSGVALTPATAGGVGPIAVFETGKGLMPSALGRGRLPAEQVDSVMTFTGSAFRVPSAATSVLVFEEGSRSYALGPKGPNWAAPSLPIAGLSQGAILESGQGRVAVFGEAAMFTAQLAGPKNEPMGMNAPGAKQNYQFVLNLMRWLSRAPERSE